MLETFSNGWDEVGVGDSGSMPWRFFGMAAAVLGVNCRPQASEREESKGYLGR